MKKIALVLFAAGAFFLLRAAENSHDELLNRARSGNCDAQYRLAAEYFSGRSRKANPVLAHYWFRKAADNGHPASQYNLGRCFEGGWGCKVSPGMALKYYKLAMVQGVLPAIQRYAELLYRGVAAEKGPYGEFPALPADREQALQLLRNCAKHYPPALISLTRHLFMDAPKHGAELRELLARYCAGGGSDPEALLLYASCLRSGIGGDIDIASGVKFLQKAADAGNMEAQAQLGEILFVGSGLPRNPARAMQYTRRAANAGNPRALVNLGRMLLAGMDGAKYDPTRAVEMFRKAAASGYPPALRQLADCQLNGIGTEQNYAEAFDNYRAAAAGGDDEACCKLGELYASGTGIAKDETAAFYWYRRAAGYGSVRGMRKMAGALLEGRGVKADRKRAMELLQKLAPR